jgi:mRNA-degrading endonuclease RelE of RelBE toxin-antitoxin system
MQTLDAEMRPCRVRYRIDENHRVVLVLGVDHRRATYRT